MPKLRTPALVTLALCAALLAPASGAAPTPIPVLDETVPGSAAFGFVVEAGSTGSVTFKLRGDVPTASIGSLAAYLLHPDGSPFFSMISVGFNSPDRFMLVTNGEDRGHDLSLLPADVGLDLGDDANPDGSCPYACLELRIDGEPGRVHKVLMWLGSVEETQVQVLGDAETKVDVLVGEALVLGDAELEEAATNVQVQQTVAKPAVVGAKLVEDARVPFDVEHGLYGLWGQVDFKAACSKGVGCVGKANVDDACWQLAGVACGTSRLGWTGPASEGGTGAHEYRFDGASTGGYEFVVEQKVDAYVTREYVELPRAGFLVSENFGFLTVADVGLPG